MNVCTSLVYLLYIYHSCDVLYFCFYIMRGWPFVVV